jgi:hypothetical protein
MPTSPPSSATYLFQWGWGGEHSPLPDPWSWRLGAAHGMDIPFLLHGGVRPIMAPLSFTKDNEAGRLALAEAMMGYVARFAHEGTPGARSADSPTGNRGATGPTARSTSSSTPTATTGSCTATAASSRPTRSGRSSTGSRRKSRSSPPGPRPASG